MISFWRIFWLEWTALWRSWTLPLLAFGVGLWSWLIPHFLHGDGTVEGVRELTLRYAFGGATAIIALTLLTAAAGSLSAERLQGRLMLALVRPVSRLMLALGRIAALIAAAAVAFSVAVVSELIRNYDSPPCNYVYRPLMPSVKAVAEAGFDAFMHDAETPPAMKRLSRREILHILEQRALDDYESIAVNEVKSWRFDEAAFGARMALRLRFTNAIGLRDDVAGTIAYCGSTGTVLNVTRSVVEIPLLESERENTRENRELQFRNCGRRPLLVRSRRDVELLVVGDAFGWNLLRAAVQMLALTAILISVGMFLGSALGRPVAVFTAMAMLLTGELAPEVIASYPEETAGNTVDAVGLAITRGAAAFTRPLGTIRPLDPLCAGDRIAAYDVWESVAMGLVISPLLAALLAAAVMPRRPVE